MNSEEQQIRELVAGWMEATKAGEIDRVLSLMAADAVFLTPGNPPMSKADFANAAKGQAEAGIGIDGRSEIQEVQVMGDWGFARSYLTVIVTRQGKSMKRAGDVLTIFRKQGGDWLLARDANLLAPIAD